MIGAVCAIAAVAIWAGWLVMMRVGVNTNLAPFDLTALRSGVAGIVLLPVVLRRGLAFNRLGWPGFAAVVIGAGAPVQLLVGAGLSFAPVGHASVLTYGILPLIVAGLAAVALKERLVPPEVRPCSGRTWWLGDRRCRYLELWRATEHRPRAVPDGCLPVVLLRGGDAARSPRRPACGRHRRRRLAARIFPCT